MFLEPLRSRSLVRMITSSVLAGSISVRWALLSTRSSTVQGPYQTFQGWHGTTVKSNEQVSPLQCLGVGRSKRRADQCGPPYPIIGAFIKPGLVNNHISEIREVLLIHDGFDFQVVLSGPGKMLPMQWDKRGIAVEDARYLLQHV